jgi:uncharacterized membrane protein YkoI
MRRLSYVVSLPALAVLVAAAASQEKKLALDQVPKNIISAVEAKFPGATLKGASTEKEQGEFVYEVTIEHKKHKIDVSLKKDGSIIGYERQIEVSKLPKGVTAALHGAYANATYRIAEQVYKKNDEKFKVAYYEVLLVTGDNQKVEVQVTREGKILKEEKKAPAKEKKPQKG